MVDSTGMDAQSIVQIVAMIDSIKGTLPKEAAPVRDMLQSVGVLIGSYIPIRATLKEAMRYNDLLKTLLSMQWLLSQVGFVALAVLGYFGIKQTKKDGSKSKKWKIILAAVAGFCLLLINVFPRFIG